MLATGDGFALLFRNQIMLSFLVPELRHRDACMGRLVWDPEGSDMTSVASMGHMLFRCYFPDGC